MKIEKISDSQIRCILTREDLEKRQLRLGELAYGTPKARALFHDMMEQAYKEFGFEAENYPLMIEAIPLSEGSIVLIVTKAENPEELDTRFSNFAPSVQREAVPVEPAQEAVTPLDQLLRTLHSRADSAPLNPREEMERRRRFMLTSRLYSFPSLSSAINAARHVGSGFTGQSSLYQDRTGDLYYLLLTMEDMEEVSSMQSILAALTEYGHAEPVFPVRHQYLQEHCTPVCLGNALSVLASL